MVSNCIIETSLLEDFEFSYITDLLCGSLYEIENNGLIIDNRINSNQPFAYSEYTKEQNYLMSKYNKLFRIYIDSKSDLLDLRKELCKLINKDFYEDRIRKFGSSRELKEVDPTMPEALFEQAFIDLYGREELNKVSREFPIIDIDGNTRWVDYVIHKRDFNIMIEKNGEKYHHPLIITRKQYVSQLKKQNSIVSYGDKVFRWSLESMHDRENFAEEMKRYFGESYSFLPGYKIKAKRKNSFKLHRHQQDIVDSLGETEYGYNSRNLVVLPTGTGKTEILIHDVIKEFKVNQKIRALIVAPTLAIKNQTIAKIKQRLPNYSISIDELSTGDQVGNSILIQTYAWLCRNYTSFPSDYFDYLAVDEAHHAVAPSLMKAIQHFNPKTIIGLTATDQRLDEKKLEDVFGEYETNLTLKEAIEQNLLAPIRAFRVQSNLNISEIRYNGKDYVNSDLQKTVIVPSRDQLVVDTLKKYFVNEKLRFMSGIIFCVSVRHAEVMAKRMRDNGLSAESVSGSDGHSSAKVSDYQKGNIQFLTTCSLLNEGWDSPRTSIIVMSRPTMSKVLYTQQLGRGTRKYQGKEALYVIDVVDNYGGMGSLTNRPWSIHALLGINQYQPWSNILGEDLDKDSNELLILDGLFEKERRIEEIDIFTFEKYYGDYINSEQLAREFFVSTGTVKSWIKKGKISPDIEIPVGRKTIFFFSPDRIDDMRNKLNLEVHDETTQYSDFFDFIDEGNYTMSYKMVMILSMFKIIDHNGECSLDDLVDEYTKFYFNQHKENRTVDRSNCPYTEEFLSDRSSVKKSILANPFEKFERKRFMYHCKDLNRISFSNNLWIQIVNNNDQARIKRKFYDDLLDYYNEMGGVSKEWEKSWDI